MDIAVLCSLREGFSNVILEAMASGKPVVASNVGGNPEAVRPEITGSLFEPNDAEKLAAEIICLLQDLPRRTAMSEAARESAVRQFSLETMLARYDAIYREHLNDAALTTSAFLGHGGR